MNTVFYERRPRFQAVQFNGHIDDVNRMKCATLAIKGYTVHRDDKPFKMVLDLKISLGSASPATYRINLSDWMVVTPDGSVQVLTDDEFSARYEAAK